MWVSVSCCVYGWSCTDTVLSNQRFSIVVLKKKKDASFLLSPPILFFYHLLLLSVISHSPSLQTPFHHPSICPISAVHGLGLAQTGDGVLWERVSGGRRADSPGGIVFHWRGESIMSHEKETPKLSCWLQRAQAKPKTQFFHSFVSWQFTVLPWHRHTDLWLHVSDSEGASRRAQHVMEVDSLKNHAHGWLMWQIKVTTEKKYLAADHTHQVLIYSFHAKQCNGIVISPWNHAWCRIYLTGCHVCCLNIHSKLKPLMVCTQEFVVVGFVGEYAAVSRQVKTLLDLLDFARTWQLAGFVCP